LGSLNVLSREDIEGHFKGVLHLKRMREQAFANQYRNMFLSVQKHAFLTANI
jgi:hypothetical protein